MLNLKEELQLTSKEKKFENNGFIQWRYYFEDKQTGNTYFQHITENTNYTTSSPFKAVNVYHIKNDECRFCKRHAIEKSTCEGLLKYNLEIQKYFISIDTKIKTEATVS